MDSRTAYTLGWLYGAIYRRIPDGKTSGTGLMTLAHSSPFLALGQLHNLAEKYSPGFSEDESISAAFNELPSVIEERPKGAEWEAYWTKGYYRGKSGGIFEPPNMDIKELRKAKGLSQDVLAKTVGVSREQISRWETGLNAPSQKNIEKLKEILL